MENVYQPPGADLTLPEDMPAYAPDQSPFFVTSTGKMVLLYLATMGMYSIYWFYKHWHAQKHVQGAKVMPAARSLFQIFFTHSLFSRIANAYEQETGKAWKYQGMAWLFIIASIASQILDKMSNKSKELGILDVMPFAILPVTMLPLYLAQRHANIAARDPRGISNHNITLLNWLFIAPCGLLWMAAVLSYAMAAGLLPDFMAQWIFDLYHALPGDD